MNRICLILAAIMFGIGAIPTAPPILNWSNAGFFFLTLSLILP